LSSFYYCGIDLVGVDANEEPLEKVKPRVVWPAVIIPM